MVKENNVVSLAEYKKQKDSAKLADILKLIISSLRQDAINNIDQVLTDLGERHNDLFKICNWKYDFRYSEDKKSPWISQEIPLNIPYETIRIHKRQYEEYLFLKKLIFDLSKKYNFD